MLHIQGLQPNPKNRSIYSVRGIVISHGIHESGWWIFKDRIPVVRVQIDKQQLAAFNDLAHEQMHVLNGGTLPGITPVLEIGVAKENMEKFPVDAEVGITFGYSDQLAQFYTAARPLEVLKTQVMAPGVELENELLAAA